MNKLGRPKAGVIAEPSTSITMVVPDSLLKNPIIAKLRKKKQFSQVIRRLIEEYLKNNSTK